jgi:hypothetical protein
MRWEEYTQPLLTVNQAFGSIWIPQQSMSIAADNLQVALGLGMETSKPEESSCKTWKY